LIKPHAARRGGGSARHRSSRFFHVRGEESLICRGCGPIVCCISRAIPGLPFVGERYVHAQWETSDKLKKISLMIVDKRWELLVIESVVATFIGVIAAISGDGPNEARVVLVSLPCHQDKIHNRSQKPESSLSRHVIAVRRSQISIMKDVRERDSPSHSSSNCCGPVRRRKANRSIGGRSVFLHCRAATGEKRYSRAREEREHGERKTELSTEKLR